MRRDTWIRNSSPAAVAQAVVDQLEAVEVEEHHREVAARVGLARAASACTSRSWKRRAVGQPGQAVVEGDVVQLRLGVAARADVLHLQDQARRRRAGLGEEAAVQRHPDLARRRGGGSAASTAKVSIALLRMRRELARRAAARRRASTRSLNGCADQRLARAAPSSAPSAALACSTRPSKRHQRHADRGVREGAVEAPLAVAQRRAGAAPTARPRARRPRRGCVRTASSASCWRKK